MQVCACVCVCVCVCVLGVWVWGSGEKEMCVCAGVSPFNLPTSDLLPKGRDHSQKVVESGRCIAWYCHSCSNFWGGELLLLLCFFVFWQCQTGVLLYHIG